MQDKMISTADFSSGLFWDVDESTLDIDQHIKFVVGRVLEAGTMEDWRLLCRHISLSGIIDIARNLRSIDPKSLAFLSVVGQLPMEQFRCYTLKQSMKTHWIY